MKQYILPLHHQKEKKNRNSKKSKPLDFDVLFLAKELNKELLMIYKYFWPNEISCKKQKNDQSKEDWYNSMILLGKLGHTMSPFVYLQR